MDFGFSFGKNGIKMAREGCMPVNGYTQQLKECGLFGVYAVDIESDIRFRCDIQAVADVQRLGLGSCHCYCSSWGLLPVLAQLVVRHLCAVVARLTSPV